MELLVKCFCSPALAAPAAAKFVAALRREAPEKELKKLRTTLRVLLAEAEEKEEVVVEARELPLGLLARRQRVKELLGELVDLIMM